MSSARPARRDDRRRPADRRSAPDRARTEPDAARLAWALLPLRLFLGVTFVYGGIQKFTDPGFLHPGAPTYIGTQLHGFANGTPGGLLLRAFAIPHPALSGVGVAVVEIAVGLLVTTGLLTRPAAVVGLVLNLVLFLTNSWHTYPYFLGSDIVFVFAWSPFVLVGAAWQPTLEPVVDQMTLAWARRGSPAPSAHRPRRLPGAATLQDGAPLTRRGAIGAVLGVLTAATGAIAGISVLLRGSYRPARSLSASASPSKVASTSTSTSVSAAASTSSGRARPPGATAGLPAGAVKLGAATQLPIGQGATYTDPGDGQPDIVIRESSGTLVAYSAVCPHAGCTVGYQGGQILCPCHGSVFNAKTGAVVRGPAVTGLARRRVIQHAGEIYAVRA